METREGLGELRCGRSSSPGAAELAGLTSRAGGGGRQPRGAATCLAEKGRLREGPGQPANLALNLEPHGSCASQAADPKDSKPGCEGHGNLPLTAGGKGERRQPGGPMAGEPDEVTFTLAEASRDAGQPRIGFGHHGRTPWRSWHQVTSW